MKRCFKCGVRKPLDEFYRHPQMGDGRLNKCKSCTKRDVGSNYRRRRPQYQDYERRRETQPERKANKAAYQRSHRSAHPDRYKARTAVGNAVRDGRLKKLPCEVCGAKKVHAHHDDYAKPLDVRWFCVKHHHIEGHGHLAAIEAAA